MSLYFPEPYDDEVIYSLISRYHYYMGNGGTKYSFLELFGTSNIIPTVELPCNLQVMCNMINNRLYNVEFFINNHTNLPFYLPFLDRKRQNYIKKLMVKSNGKSIYTKIGITAGGICNKKHLFYCPVCIEEDIKNVGEAYFHRIHQAPGVFVCPKHYCYIKKYSVTRNDIGRIKFIRICISNTDNSVHIIEDNKVNKYALEVAQSIVYLLNNDLSEFNQNIIVKKYKYVLSSMGLVTPKNRVRQKMLVKMFISFYGTEVLNIFQSSLNYNESDWLREITRKSNKLIHPIRHILFILFLNGDVKSFFEGYKIRDNQINRKTWPCLNYICNYFRRHVIPEVKINVDYKAKKQIGTFKCPFCGFSYARNINSEDIYKIGKVKAFGFLWENKLMELLKVRELNIRELARLMKCDSKTIIKYSEKLQNCISKKNGRSANKIIEQGYRERYSIEMLALIKNHPEYTRSKIREKLKKQYAWFYRNDRQWINDNLPIGVSNINNENKVKQRIDWSQRDNEIYLQVKNKYEELMNIKKAIRITKTIIGNKLGVASLLEHYSYKLPKTSKYIIEITETVEEFQVRRVNNICNYMLAEGRQIKRWKVMRLAGLRKTCSARVIERIDYFIQLDESKII